MNDGPDRASLLPLPDAEYQLEHPGWDRRKAHPLDPDPAPPPPPTPGFDPDLADALSAVTWANLDFPPETRLLGDVITPSTRTFLVGMTGLGKTNFAYALAGAMASGRGLFNWDCDRPSKWLIIDGEMPNVLVKTRAGDMLRRAGGTAIPPHQLTIYSRAREDEFAKLFPGLGRMPPLNTEAGHNFVLALIDMLGGVDGVIFDNVMSLGPGDQRDEQTWAQCTSLVDSLSKKEIAQIWCDHTGINSARQYGSSTKGWRFDNIIMMTPVVDEELDLGHLSFKISFDAPSGKARRRTPDNWHQFVPRVIRLVDDERQTEDAPPVVKLTKAKTAHLPDKAAVLMSEIQHVYTSMGWSDDPGLEGTEARSITRAALRDRLIDVGFFSEVQLLPIEEGKSCRPKLTKVALTDENNALMKLKRRGFIDFNRINIWRT